MIQIYCKETSNSLTSATLDMLGQLAAPDMGRQGPAAADVYIEPFVE